MPGPPAPAWNEDVRVLVAAGLSVAESARKLGLPFDRVRKFAERNGLCKQREKAVAVLKELSPTVATVAEILADTSDEDAKACRFGLIRRARTVIEAAADRATVDPEKALLESPLLNSEAGTLQKANAKGFERQPTSTENHAHLHLHQAVRPELGP